MLIVHHLNDCRFGKDSYTARPLIVGLVNAGKLAAPVTFEWTNEQLHFAAPTWDTMHAWRTVDHLYQYTYDEDMPDSSCINNGRLDPCVLDRDPDDWDDIPRGYHSRNGLWLSNDGDLSKSAQEEHRKTFDYVRIVRGMVPLPGFMTAALMDAKSMDAETLCLAAIKCINNRMAEDPNPVRAKVYAELYAYVPQWLWMLSCIPWFSDQEDLLHTVSVSYCDDCEKAVQWSAAVHRRDVTHSTRHDNNENNIFEA